MIEVTLPAEGYDEEARRTLLTAMERLAAHVTQDSTTLVVALPSPDSKAKIIGREGRNIRAFAQATGVDLLVDDSPDTVAVSSFDPVRREVARLALANLLLDERIHPVRIKEAVAHAEGELETVQYEAAVSAASGLGLELPKPVLEALGRLKFRLSSGQSVLDHSVEVAEIAATIAGEIGMEAGTAKRAGLLHDIGKGMADSETGHALTGMAFLEPFGLAPEVLHAVGGHHHELPPGPALTQLITIADAISASRPGARKEKPDAFRDRLHQMEEIARDFRGVEHAFAILAGRELRVLVKSDQMDDVGAERLCGQIARAVRQQVGGQPVRVTVVREVTFSESTK